MSKSICTIEIKNKKLHIIYNKREYGLHSLFSSDERIKEYILNHSEEAFFDAVNQKENDVYFVNIASVIDFGAFEWKNADDLLHRQLSIYMPIIQKFIEKATTEKIDPSNYETNT